MTHSPADLMERVADSAEEIASLRDVLHEISRAFHLFGVSLKREARDLRASEGAAGPDGRLPNGAILVCQLSDAICWRGCVPGKCKLESSPAKGEGDGQAGRPKTLLWRVEEECKKPVPYEGFHSSAQAGGDGARSPVNPDQDVARQDEHPGSDAGRAERAAVSNPPDAPSLSQPPAGAGPDYD